MCMTSMTVINASGARKVDSDGRISWFHTISYPKIADTVMFRFTVKSIQLKKNTHTYIYIHICILYYIDTYIYINNIQNVQTSVNPPLCHHPFVFFIKIHRGTISRSWRCNRKRNFRAKPRWNHIWNFSCRDDGDRMGPRRRPRGPKREEMRRSWDDMKI